MIRTIIVDDEYPTRQELASILANIKDVEIRFASIVICFAGAYVSSKLYENINKFK